MAAKLPSQQQDGTLRFGANPAHATMRARMASRVFGDIADRFRDHKRA
jgi:hypothetical protein